MTFIREMTLIFITMSLLPSLGLADFIGPKQCQMIFAKKHQLDQLLRREVEAPRISPAGGVSPRVQVFFDRFSKLESQYEIPTPLRTFTKELRSGAHGQSKKGLAPVRLSRVDKIEILKFFEKRYDKASVELLALMLTATKAGQIRLEASQRDLFLDTVTAKVSESTSLREINQLLYAMKKARLDASDSLLLRLQDYVLNYRQNVDWSMSDLDLILFTFYKVSGPNHVAGVFHPNPSFKFAMDRRARETVGREVDKVKAGDTGIPGKAIVRVFANLFHIGKSPSPELISHWHFLRPALENLASSGKMAGLGRPESFVDYVSDRIEKLEFNRANNQYNESVDAPRVEDFDIPQGLNDF